MPLGVREGRLSAEEYSGPFDGVPEWLAGPLWDWVCDRLPVYDDKGYNQSWHVDAYRRMATTLRFSLEDGSEPIPNNALGMRNRLWNKVQARPALLLEIADYWLGVGAATEYRAEKIITRLDELLARAGSMYRVVAGEPSYLGRRVSKEEVNSLASLQANTDKPGQHLGRAWRAIFGLEPRPGEGYREAIKAVEAAAIPIVSPNNQKATLGTVIADLKNRPESWRVDLHSPTPELQVPAIVGVLELLWKGQSDRHGTPDPDAPLEVTLPQAEAALHLALGLVQWFVNGTVASV